MEAPVGEKTESSPHKEEANHRGIPWADSDRKKKYQEKNAESNPEKQDKGEKTDKGDKPKHERHEKREKKERDRPPRAEREKGKQEYDYNPDLITE